MKINTRSSAQSTLHNTLLQARHRAGLERKQVTFLLSKKTTDELSRYERGLYPPNLLTALKFEIIYRTPLRLLFQELFEKLQMEIEELRRRNALMFPNDICFPKSSDQLQQEESCFYAEMLQDHTPNEMELQAATKHIIALNNVVRDYRYNLKPDAENP